MTISTIAPFIGLTMLVIFGGVLWFIASKCEPDSDDKPSNK